MILAAIVLGSCTTFYFDQPQPVDVKEEPGFPKEIQGVWVEDGDSIVVAERYFLFTDRKIKKLSKEELDTSSRFMIKGNRAFERHEGALQSHSFEWKNDTAHILLKRKEYRFTLSDSISLRSFGKYYFVNFNRGDDWWDVYLIERKKDGLKIRLLKKEDIRLLQSLFPVEVVDSVGTDQYYKVALTKKQMRTFIKKGGFSDTIELSNEP